MTKHRLNPALVKGATVTVYSDESGEHLSLTPEGVGAVSVQVRDLKIHRDASGPFIPHLSDTEITTLLGSLELSTE